MTELISHNSETIETIYQLLGTKENDITRAIAWTLKKCPTFLSGFIGFFGIETKNIASSDITIFYQKFEKHEKEKNHTDHEDADQKDEERSYTDLEITDHKSFHIILEAKRGWILPGRYQLSTYAEQRNWESANKVIVTVSECSYEYAKSHLPFEKTDNGIPVFHISWKELKTLAEKARTQKDAQTQKNANHEQKRLLKEFEKYLGGIMSTQNVTSNEVYVVSLGSQETIAALKKDCYWCPIGAKRWPKVVPNYFGFRYDGKLQSIRHVESYEITKNIHDVFGDAPDKECEMEHYCFTLDKKEILPEGKEIKTGKLYRGARVWAMLDLLLTCDTIEEAHKKSQDRKKPEEA